MSKEPARKRYGIISAAAGLVLLVALSCQKQSDPVFPDVKASRDSILTQLDAAYDDFYLNYLSGDTLDYTDYFPLNIGNRWEFWDNTIDAKKVEYIPGIVNRGDGAILFVKVDSIYRVYDVSGSQADSVIVETTYLYEYGPFIISSEMTADTANSFNPYNELLVNMNYFNPGGYNDWIDYNNDLQYCGVVEYLGADSLDFLPVPYYAYRVSVKTSPREPTSSLVWQSTSNYAPGVGKYYLEEYSNIPSVIFKYQLVKVTVNGVTFP